VSRSGRPSHVLLQPARGFAVNGRFTAGPARKAPRRAGQAPRQMNGGQPARHRLSQSGSDRRGGAPRLPLDGHPATPSAAGLPLRPAVTPAPGGTAQNDRGRRHGVHPARRQPLEGGAATRRALRGLPQPRPGAATAAAAAGRQAREHADGSRTRPPACRWPGTWEAEHPATIITNHPASCARTAAPTPAAARRAEIGAAPAPGQRPTHAKPPAPLASPRRRRQPGAPTRRPAPAAA
jgi:hypothetical protein